MESNLDFKKIFDSTQILLLRHNFCNDLKILANIQEINYNLFIKNKNDQCYKSNYMDYFSLNFNTEIENIKKSFSNISLKSSSNYEDKESLTLKMQASTILMIVTKYLYCYKELINIERFKSILEIIEEEIKYANNIQSCVFYLYIINDKIGINGDYKGNIFDLFCSHVKSILENVSDVSFLSQLFLNEFVFLHLNEFYLRILLSLQDDLFYTKGIYILSIQILLITIFIEYDQKFKKFCEEKNTFESKENFKLKETLEKMLLFIVQRYINILKANFEYKYDSDDFITKYSNLVVLLTKLISIDNFFDIKTMISTVESLCQLYLLSINLPKNNKFEEIIISKFSFNKDDKFSKTININEFCKNNDHKQISIITIFKFLESLIFLNYNKTTINQYASMLNLKESKIEKIIDQGSNDIIEDYKITNLNTSDILLYNVYLIESVYDNLFFVDGTSSTYNTKNIKDFKVFPDYVYITMIQMCNFLFKDSIILIKQFLIFHLRYEHQNKILLFHLAYYYYKSKIYDKCKIFLKHILSQRDETFNLKLYINEELDGENSNIKDCSLTADDYPINFNLLNNDSYVVSKSIFIFNLIDLEENTLSNLIENAIINLERISLASKINSIYRVDNEEILRSAYYILSISYYNKSIKALTQDESNELLNYALNCIENSIGKNLISELISDINSSDSITNDGCISFIIKDIGDQICIFKAEDYEVLKDYSTNQYSNDYLKYLDNIPALKNKNKKNYLLNDFVSYINYLYRLQEYNKAFSILIKVEQIIDVYEGKEGLNFILLKCLLLISLQRYSTCIEIIESIKYQIINDLKSKEKNNNFDYFDRNIQIISFFSKISNLNYYLCMLKIDNSSNNNNFDKIIAEYSNNFNNDNQVIFEQFVIILEFYTKTKIDSSLIDSDKMWNAESLLSEKESIEIIEKSKAFMSKSLLKYKIESLKNEIFRFIKNSLLNIFNISEEVEMNEEKISENLFSHYGYFNLKFKGMGYNLTNDYEYVYIVS